ncbi:dTDP-4-dehydrorhamnose 3,5-epimerase [Terribacillus aidingensis]|uniref:dTDP-4-dehydrorhamnose 3,5-epimerase n=1 Tax=Terribacillus aidingensis TaxID=586416 RepID=A0A285N5M7_9BACI|nr:dTDP-4-dehydrorhamnose 3,5-epimerase [Terribacillus aidingensis]SNZ04774.1 dTDP-4-dehydrorhamnose 3,5-epimerase [Terribacillus aidingensis]
MNSFNTDLDGVKVIENKVFGDERGWFTESYNHNMYKENGIYTKFIQDNHSFSKYKGTLRGLHLQLYPKAQTKLVRCTRGSIFDVAIDLRPESKTFKQSYGIILSETNQKQLLIPKGFAHGFITLEDKTEVQYKVDEHYSKEHDRSIAWNDRILGIDWPTEVNVISDKDRVAPTLDTFLEREYK